MEAARFEPVIEAVSSTAAAVRVVSSTVGSSAWKAVRASTAR
jgi:hypothetical protein